MDAQQVNFAVIEKSVDAVAVVSVTGAVDMLTAPQLAIVAQYGGALHLTDVDFLASAGMQVLVASKDEADGSRLVIVADGPATSRPLKITGITDIIDLYPTLDEALANVAV